MRAIDESLMTRRLIVRLLLLVAIAFGGVCLMLLFSNKIEQWGSGDLNPIDDSLAVGRGDIEQRQGTYLEWKEGERNEKIFH